MSQPQPQQKPIIAEDTKESIVDGLRHMMLQLEVLGLIIGVVKESEDTLEDEVDSYYKIVELLQMLGE